MEETFIKDVKVESCDLLSPFEVTQNKDLLTQNSEADHKEL